MSASVQSFVASSPQLEAYKDRAMADFKEQYSSLQTKREEVQEKYVDPAIQKVRETAESRPIATASLGVFFALAFLPVLSFLLFAAGTILLVGGGALCFGLFWCATLIFLGSVALLGTLALLAVLTAFVVFWGLVGFATLRLVACVVRAPSLADGAKDFDAEMRALFLSSPKPTANGIKPEPTIS